MRQTYIILKRFCQGALLGGVALCLSTGCDKVNPDSAKGTIHITAVLPAAATKAAWDEDADNYQRIKWETGDQVRIAMAVPGAADITESFTVTPTSNQGRFSYGSLDTDWLWDKTKNKADYKFWGVYPAGVSLTKQDNAYYVQGNIGTQEGAPADDGLLMVAHPDGVTIEGTTATMDFYPAFTTVRVQLKNGMDTQATINDIQLSSAEDALQGVFDAKIAEAGVTDAKVQVPYGVEGEEAESGEVTLWEGSISGQGTITGESIYDNFKNAKAGETIRIYFTTTSPYYYSLSLYGYNTNWPGLNIYNGGPTVSSNDLLSSSESYFEFALTDYQIQQLLNDGSFNLTIQTQSLNVTKVTYSGGASEPSIKYVAKESVVRTSSNTLAANAIMSEFAEFRLIPREIGEMKLTVKFTVNGQENTKSLDLSAILAREGLTFEPCKQYRFSGIILPDTIEPIEFKVVSNAHQDLHTGSDTWIF